MANFAKFGAPELGPPSWPPAAGRLNGSRSASAAVAEALLLLLLLDRVRAPDLPKLGTANEYQSDISGGTWNEINFNKRNETKRRLSYPPCVSFCFMHFFLGASSPKIKLKKTGMGGQRKAVHDS